MTDQDGARHKLCAFPQMNPTCSWEIPLRLKSTSCLRGFGFVKVQDIIGY